MATRQFKLWHLFAATTVAAIALAIPMALAQIGIALLSLFIDLLLVLVGALAVSAALLLFAVLPGMAIVFALESLGRGVAKVFTWTMSWSRETVDHQAE